MVALGLIISFGRGEPLGVRGLSTVLYWYFVTTLSGLGITSGPEVFTQLCGPLAIKSVA